MRCAALCFVCDVYLTTTGNGIELTCEWNSSRTYRTYVSALSTIKTSNGRTNTASLHYYSIVLVHNCIRTVHKIPLHMLIRSRIHAHNREHSFAMRQPFYSRWLYKWSSERLYCRHFCCCFTIPTFRWQTFYKYKKNTYMNFEWFFFQIYNISNHFGFHFLNNFSKRFYHDHECFYYV